MEIMLSAHHTFPSTQVEELQALNAEKQKRLEESLKSDDNFVVVDKEEVLKKMLEILKPGETVGKVRLCETLAI